MTFIMDLNPISSVIENLAKHPAIDPSRIALQGDSFGGGCAIVHSSMDDRIRCVTVANPSFDSEVMRKKEIENLFYFSISKLSIKTKYNYEDINKQMSYYNPKNFASQLKAPIQFIVGDNDQIIDFNGSKITF